MRLFVAIALPEAVEERLSMISCGLPGARWLSAGQHHLTLRFIGELDSSRFLDVREALAAVRAEPFSLQLQGTGFFPPRKKPQVLWVGVEKNEQLLRLRNRVESVLVAAGLAPEQRKFAPHITLARLKKTPSVRLGRYLEAHSMFFLPPFQVQEFRLYTSVLSPGGAKHFVEQEYDLGGQDGQFA
jgi:2'-5' RNA ligase